MPKLPRNLLLLSISVNWNKPDYKCRFWTQNVWTNNFLKIQKLYQLTKSTYTWACFPKFYSNPIPFSSVFCFILNSLSQKKLSHESHFITKVNKTFYKSKIQSCTWNHYSVSDKVPLFIHKIDFLLWLLWYQTWNAWFQAWIAWFQAWIAWFQTWIAWFQTWIAWFQTWITWFLTWIAWFQTWITWFQAWIVWF